MGPMDLAGSSVLVTGASSGIGRETAILFSSLNARVVLVGRNEERLRETLRNLHGEDHIVSVFDLSSTEDIASWMKQLVARVGPFKALVHAAGKQLTMPVRLVSGTAFDDLIRTNLTSAVMLTKTFWPEELPHTRRKYRLRLLGDGHSGKVGNCRILGKQSRVNRNDAVAGH
jgi:NAD(P)-dependent dehydrogenase (short-subunit alcohol dehydrogenase family)